MFNNVSINISSNYRFNFGTNESPSLPYRVITFPYHLITTPIHCTWGKLKSIFRSRSELHQDILSLANSMSQDYIWTENEKELVIKALNSMDYIHMRKDLARIFNNAAQPIVVEIIKAGIQQSLDADKAHLNLRPFDLMDLCWKGKPGKVKAESNFRLGKFC